MRTLVVGDVHGCRRELEALLDDAAPDRAWLVGDLYTKGPDPGGVWQLIRERTLHAVLGNHDERLLQVIDGRRTNDDGARRVIAQLDAVDRDRVWLHWLRELPLFAEPFEPEPNPWTVVHASLHPTGALHLTTREMALSWRRWPDNRGSAPPWHEVYSGDRRVLFGHDARQGLVRVHR